MATYERLRDYLIGQRSAELVLSLDEIERIIGDVLPRSARQRPQYWANATKTEQRNPPNRAARDAGYTAYLIPKDQKVRFIRES